MGIGAIIKEDFSVSMHFLRREQPGIMKLLLLAAAVSLFVAGTAVVGFPYLVRTVLGLSATHYGIAESAMGVVSVLGSLCVVVLAKKAAGAPSCHSFSILWDLPHSVRYCFSAAGKLFYPLSDFAHHVLCLSAWMQPVFHLCHFHYTGTDTGASDG